MAHPLDGAAEKFSRAKEQFDELVAELDAFFNVEPKPHSSLGQFDMDAWEWIEQFQVKQAPPLRLGVILGDCIHNLRSALDHVVWQATILNKVLAPDKKTQFPIASKSEEQFNAMSNQRIPGLSDAHRALVKRVQPYHAGDRAEAHPLAVLANLSNTDKHQVVNAAYSVMSADAGATLDHLVGSYQGPGQSPMAAFWMVKQGTRLEHNTPWLRLQLRRDQEAPREMQVNGDITLGIAFGDIGLDAGEFPKIAEAVKKIIEAFAVDFPETEMIEPT